MLGDYWGTYGGAHLAEDIGKSGAANAPVYSVADGVVLVASPNSSSYVNVALIQHTLGDGSKVCSFYGQLGSLSVSPGQTVARGAITSDPRARSPAAPLGGSMSHLDHKLPTLRLLKT